MDFNEIIALYGVDVILLTFVNVALSEVLKHTVFKNKPKVVTALVYAAAIVMYIIYKSIYVQNALYTFENLASVLEHGISIGTLTMLVCSLIDRVFGGGTTATATDTIRWLLKGWVKKGSEKECANKILGLHKAMNGEQFRSAAAEVLMEYAADGVSESQIKAIAALACEAAEKIAEAETDDETSANGGTDDDTEDAEPVTI